MSFSPLLMLSTQVLFDQSVQDSRHHELPAGEILETAEETLQQVTA